MADAWTRLSPADSCRSPHSPFYQLPPSVQRHSPNPLLVAPTPPALQKLLGELAWPQSRLGWTAALGLQCFQDGPRVLWVVVPMQLGVGCRGGSSFTFPGTLLDPLDGSAEAQVGLCE